jgi:hypothetical protein
MMDADLRALRSWSATRRYGGAEPEVACLCGPPRPRTRLALATVDWYDADAGHRLETHAADVDDDARAQLAGDVRTLDQELATLKALLIEAVDWDSDLERLLGGETPLVDEDAAEKG